jgi:hypothetical protein
MRTIAVLVTSALLASPVFAEQQIMRSSSPQGVQIQGNADVRAQQESAAAVSVGQDNEAKNSAGAIRAGTQIQGNTVIKAEQKNARAVAVGKDNKAANEAGVVGGK